MIKAIVLSLLAMLTFFILHFTWFHLRRVKRRFQSLVKLFIGVGVLYAIVYWSSLGDYIRGLIPLIDPGGDNPSFGWNAFYCATGFFYYFFTFLGYVMAIYFPADRSIALRIAREVYKHKNQSLTMDEFKKIFEAEQVIFQRRFNEMVESGYLVYVGKEYRLTPLGRFTAAYNEFLIRFLNLEGG